VVFMTQVQKENGTKKKKVGLDWPGTVFEGYETSLGEGNTKCKRNHFVLSTKNREFSESQGLEDFMGRKVRGGVRSGEECLRDSRGKILWRTDGNS